MPQFFQNTPSGTLLNVIPTLIESEIREKIDQFLDTHGSSGLQNAKADLDRLILDLSTKLTQAQTKIATSYHYSSPKEAHDSMLIWADGSVERCMEGTAFLEQTSPNRRREINDINESIKNTARQYVDACERIARLKDASRYINEKLAHPPKASVPAGSMPQ